MSNAATRPACLPVARSRGPLIGDNVRHVTEPLHQRSSLSRVGREMNVASVNVRHAGLAEGGTIRAAENLPSAPSSVRWCQIWLQRRHPTSADAASIARGI